MLYLNIADQQIIDTSGSQDFKTACSKNTCKYFCTTSKDNLDVGKLHSQDSDIWSA